MLDTFSGNVQPHSIEDELKDSFLSYAMSVIVSRALPDARDGLKPVHRRVLYAMQDLGLQPNRPYRKSATVVGDVMGKYHPHGDQAIYDALARMAQDFALRYPLVDGQGNFGSVDGDPPGAMRYTEARLTRMATEMLRDINADTVDFVPNFDESLKQPEVLPARFPNLLVNGSDGIAVGMATKIPPHNLGEVIDATMALIDDPDLDDEEIAKYIKGPDFPTGGVIVGLRGIRDAIATGRGSVRVQAKAHTEQIKGNRTQIVVTEIPYQVNKSYLLQKIAELVKDRKLQDISDLRDESERDAHSDRAEARGRAQSRPQQPLQAHPDAAELRGEPGCARRRCAEDALLQAGPGTLYRPPVRGGNAQDALRARSGQGEGPHPRRTAHRAWGSRRGRCDHPPLA